MTEDEFLDRATKAIAVLEAIEHKPYWESPIPSVNDQRIATIVELYIAATPHQRELLRTAQTDRTLDRRAYEALCTFGNRMAMLAVRRRSEPILTRALIALVMNMDWADSDARDCGYFLGPLLTYCALRIGADHERIYDLAQEIAVDEWTKSLARWPDVVSPNDLLTGIAHQVVETPAGVVFQYSGRPIPTGHLVPETENPDGQQPQLL